MISLLRSRYHTHCPLDPACRDSSFTSEREFRDKKRNDARPSTNGAPRVPAGTPCVQIIVGTGTEIFKAKLHVNLVCAASKFFRVALTGPWREAQAQKVKLPEDDPGVFRAFHDWFYGRYPPEVYGTSAARREKQRGAAYVLPGRVQFVTFSIYRGMTWPRSPGTSLCFELALTN
jgi:hypothetical protein